MSKSYKILIFLALLLSVCAIACCFYVFSQHKKIVYADTLRVVDGFNLKKELEKKEEAVLMHYKNRIDSLEAILKLDPKNKELMNVYVQNKQMADQEYTKSNQQINEIVWKRLNPLVTEYGKKNDFEIIIGANGMGNVLYGNEAKDKTEEIIKYINEHYEHGN